MNIQGIYIAGVPDERNIATDTNITLTLSACLYDEIYIVINADTEYNAHHPAIGDEYTTTYITPPLGSPTPNMDVGIVSDIGTLVNDPGNTLGNFAGSIGYFPTIDSIGIWSIPQIFWNFDNVASGSIYPSIAITILDCNTTTSTTPAPITSTSTSTSTSTTPTTILPIILPDLIFTLPTPQPSISVPVPTTPPTPESFLTYDISVTTTLPPIITTTTTTTTTTPTTPTTTKCVCVGDNIHNCLNF